MSKIPLKPHVYRELVNDIRDVTTKQITLRDRLTILDSLSNATRDIKMMRDYLLSDITLEICFVMDKFANSQSKRAHISLILRKYFEPTNEPKRN